MSIFFKSTEINIFILSHRTTDRDLYWKNIKNVVDWTEKYGYTGVLLFEGNDTFISPWVAAQEALARTKRVSPLIAVNPIYMHPFSAAKLVSSYAQIYKRRIYLNMITGTALNYLHSMDDKMSHDDRYRRIEEYIEIMKRLLSSTAPVSYSGDYYNVSELQLLPGINTEFMPSFLLSGQSDAACDVAKKTNSVGTQMLTPEMARGLKSAKAINFGILCRPTDSEAWEDAYQMFPEDPDSQIILEYSMENTDSVWKKRMQLASKYAEHKSIGYWMSPFTNFQSDGPYLVGSYDRVATIISDLIKAGIHTFILDITPNEAEYAHIASAFSAAKEKLGQSV
ncbi:LLM class flavin-dependent oxidoreductase [Cyanobium sp. Aljojuca 7D2]|uniref:LLM class flavin-dependent oxidoreductase n=1 Tax=Cyanobium sp. Aljojuca 7D2 TaxID=2823698 RepID=UPI0020CDB3F1|nr:LLM class flavin-dependent oxidoreductase [Cyanobium sp. Aljojuca 7D2]MCP9890885.1 LLM class flavin-dependent oxidoreductase [Cyanobium sp. Aljojuca 7D2]